MPASHSADLIFAEIVAAKTGLGYLIFEGAPDQQTARTIVGMIIMGLLWLASTSSISSPSSGDD